MALFNFHSNSKSVPIDGAKYLANGYLEEKFDGSRFGLELDETGWHAYSRYGIDRIENIPGIKADLEQLDLPIGTVLDGETIVLDDDRKKRWELTRSVMGTNGFNPDGPEIHYVVYDIQYYDGKKLPSNYLQMRAMLNDILFTNYEKDYSKDNIVLAKGTNIGMARAHKMTKEKLIELWQDVVTNHDGEGLMFKSLSNKWTKIKKVFTADVFVIGTTKGTGKYEGLIGALEVAVYAEDGTIWPIGKITSLGDVSTRVEATELALKGELKMQVLEVRYNEVTKNMKLRSGRFERWRHDKQAKDCLISQLKDL